MKPIELLKLERDRILKQVYKDKENRAHWLVALIDIDEKIEEQSNFEEYGQSKEERKPLMRTK